MPRPLIPFALAAVMALTTAQAMALGFGRVINATALGQPLNFSVGLRLDADESLVTECVVVEVLSGESRLPASALRVSVEPGNDPAERTLRVVSNAYIDEPVVSVNVQVTCPNRFARRFVMFIDPPVVVLAQAATPVASSPPVAPAVVRREEKPVSSPLAGASDSTAPAKPAKPAARAASRPKRAQPATASAALPKAPMGTASASAAEQASPSSRAVRAPTVGARLKLEAADDEATRDRLSPRLTGALAVNAVNSANAASASVAAGAAPVASAASAPAERAASSPSDDAAAEQALARLKTMEDSLQRLRAESQATQASLAQMQLKLRDAEGQRFSNPLVYTLAALVAALTVAVLALLWRRAGERRVAPQWWDARTAAATGAANAYADARPEAQPGDDWASPAAPPPSSLVRPMLDQAGMGDTTGSPMLLKEVQAYAQTAAASVPPDVAFDREMSVEELIDLEQQAEFFVVLGQDEAAIDLLMGHLRSSGGASPLPYLKLLEIFRGRNDHAAYERIRERFNRRFNAYAQDWQSDLMQGRSLIDYPGVTARLQALWATPLQAMQALEASLFRRDAGSATFDLPAYRELLFLYAVARDLSERDTASGSVDLLLPIDDKAAAAPRVHAPMAAGGPSFNRPASVDLDTSSLDAGPSRDDERPSRFHTDFGPTSGYLGLPGESSPKRH